MTGRTWVRLDNASNIFLAARTDADPKVFRLSAETDHEVHPVLLQQALDETYARYPLYHAVLRRGVFWYYLQDSDLRPHVTGDELHSCAPIYRADRRNLLFRVTHHLKRINLEVFHALSDGTGALWFLSDLVTAYHRLRYPEQSHEPDPGVLGAPEPARGLTGDSFAQYFRRDAAPATLTVPGVETGTAREPAPHALQHRPSVGTGRPRVYRVRGTRTPDHRTRDVELTLSAAEVLEVARAEQVSMTMYLTALFFESIRRSSGGLGRNQTLAVSVPVNLRQFFPSTSARNFFATVRVEHTYGQGAEAGAGEDADSIGAVARQLQAQFRPKATAEALEAKLRQFIRFERMPVLRVLPRPLKDLMLGLVNRVNNRGLTVAISNMGRVALPEPAEDHVARMFLHVSAARPQFCVVSHAGWLTVSFSSPFIETGHIREFARELTGHGVQVSVASTRVTEEELAETVRAGAEGTGVDGTGVDGTGVTP
ncbi:alcohol acetyltransferase [Microbacterium sp. A93]|uniref:alcohol acetyltransferase n=1 Tax=Microbacterium sp. A93 TaxID=3450716 RepID=UPI003F41E2EF